MERSDALARIAEVHAFRIGRPYGRCLEVSERLAEALRRQGFQPRVLRCSDGVLDAPDADHRWRRMPRAPDCWVHYVVQVDRVIVDLTRRQFFPDDPHPFYTDAAGLSAEWNTIMPIASCKRNCE